MFIRFPFRYLIEDYGLTYYAAFIGCSAETEASFETIAFLSEKIDELNLKIAELKRKQDSLYDDKFNNIISVETYQRLFKTTEEDIKTANEKLEKLMLINLYIYDFFISILYSIFVFYQFFLHNFHLYI